MKEMVLPGGSVRLPAFFPDGTHGSVKCLDSRDLRACGVPGVVMNTYHLISNPGISALKTLGGLRAFTGWDGPLLTDSGGFQVYSLIRENPKFGEIRRNEIIFRPESGGKLTLTPEKCIQSQFTFGSDIMMCLDYCTHPDDSTDVQALSVDITIDWARRCREEYDRLVRQKCLTESTRPRIFGIIQGGSDRALRERCAFGLREIGFDGYGFGGWPLDGEGRLVIDILELTASLMPEDSARYAMGVGRPESIAACVRMGYDLFDCVIPTREARHGRLYVWKEAPATVDLFGPPDFYSFHYIADDAHYRDPRPADEHCDCYCCTHFSRAYLRHLFRMGDPLGTRLASMHNLRFYTRLVELFI